MEISYEERLKTYFTDDEPLGPSSVSDKHKNIKELFVTENMPARNMFHRPKFIVGRKGYGKSSLLLSRYLEEDNLVVNLPSDDTFQQVIKTINRETERYVTVEQVESIWKLLIWLTICMRVYRRFDPIEAEKGGVAINQDGELDAKDLHVLRTYIDNLNIPVTKEPFDTIEKGLKALIKLAEKEDRSIENTARYISFEDFSLMDLEISICSILRRNNKSVSVMLDSLEQHELEQDAAFPAMAGFLRFVGQFQAYTNNVFIHCSLPAEIYHVMLRNVSTNPAKDFQNKELVHWSAGELLHLAAKRLSTYISLHNNYFYKTKIEPLLDLKPRDFAREFWALYLPDEFRNGRNIKEEADAYILRHTLLSPRHVVMMFTEICRRSMDSIKNGKPLCADIIIKSVKSKEETICLDVFKGWDTHYPHDKVDYEYQSYAVAHQLCNLILPSLEPVFSYRRFTEVYQQNVHDQFVFVDGEARALDVFAMLGIVGRVVDENTSSRYVYGEFEYALPSRLRYTKTSLFCVHPVFMGFFATEEVKSNLKFAVYPIGSDPTEPDYRIV